MLHTEFGGNQPAGPEKIFKGFNHIWAWQPSWSCDQHHVHRFSFPCVERRTLDRETRVRSSAGSVCCFLEQETFTPQSTGNTKE